MSTVEIPWNGMLSGLGWVQISSARQDMRGNIDAANEGERLVLTTYGRPRACLVSLKDGALLQLLEEDAGLKAQVEQLFERKREQLIAQ
jgi:antitoxin (DNA-binding transcriptional repressor) of toxin-antitoxin stability system